MAVSCCLQFRLVDFVEIIFRFSLVLLFTGWLGAASWAVSMFTAPIIIALCRRKSTRLTAVIGGLVLALGILFASFATLFHQVAFSYGKYCPFDDFDIWFFGRVMSVLGCDGVMVCSSASEPLP